MKPPRVRLRSLLIVIALAAFVMAGVVMLLRKPGSPYSTVFSGLDPVALLGSQPGYKVKGGTSWNVYNTSRGYAFKEWRGIVTAPDDPSVPRTIQKAFEDYIAKVSRGRCHTEGSLGGEPPNEPPHNADLPRHALFMFNEGDRHGDLHVWLFPDSAGSSFGFAIFLRDVPFEGE